MKATIDRVHKQRNHIANSPRGNPDKLNRLLEFYKELLNCYNATENKIIIEKYKNLEKKK